MGLDVIVFGEEEIYTTEDNITEDESVKEWYGQDNEYETADTGYNADGGIAELEDDEVIGTLTNNNESHRGGKNTIEGEDRDNYMSQGSDPSETSSPSE